MNPSVKKVRRSAYEVSPACPHYNSCGGCDFLDLSYGRQLIEKRRWIERALIGSKVPLNTLERTLGRWEDGWCFDLRLALGAFALFESFVPVLMMEGAT